MFPIEMDSGPREPIAYAGPNESWGALPVFWVTTNTRNSRVRARRNAANRPRGTGGSRTIRLGMVSQNRACPPLRVNGGFITLIRGTLPTYTHRRRLPQ